ncbi:COBRA plant protein [Dioscorea alata]|uniref:COBRA plant protein n=1 Tax=Dioscorea alata TaxID=55571 RepID=A0ACB7V6G5_DIOAL|nr:COBRA plant protein [Dioscorea alata]
METTWENIEDENYCGKGTRISIEYGSNDCYDPLDPNGNISITIDIYQWTPDGYQARVTIQNYYQYRHVEKPGWALGWRWVNKEVIWSMTGAIAIHQGDCSNFTTRVPYCCKENPVIIDLTPEAPPETRTANCCRSGVLTASGIDMPNSLSYFDMIIGHLDGKPNVKIPRNLTLLAPSIGYTCSPLVDSTPTTVIVDGGLRKEQAFRTWKSACTYSSFVAKKTPACCVSLSTFYNPRITPCPACSCDCGTVGNVPPQCTGEGSVKPPLERDVQLNRYIGCTDHMCAVRVHWHVKSNYKGHWRVKVTVSNYDFVNNHSNWNLVIQHPSFSQSLQTFSFNYTKLPTSAGTDEAALFWGLDYYNTMLVHADETDPGSVTTDVLMSKDLESFTLSNGWSFPRRIYFNGDNCQMPMPDEFPTLPNSGPRPSNFQHILFLIIFLIFHGVEP